MEKITLVGYYNNGDWASGKNDHLSPSRKPYISSPVKRVIIRKGVKKKPISKFP